MRRGQPPRKVRKENEKAMDRARAQRHDTDALELGGQVADALATVPAKDDHGRQSADERRT